MERRARGRAQSPKVGACDSRGFAGPEAFPKSQISPHSSFSSSRL